jgi:hypothetical protein
MRRLGELLFGLEPSQWTEGGRWSLDWLALPKGDRMLLLLAVVVLAVGGLWWLYRREAAHISPAMRAMLLGLRLCALGLAVVMLLEPIIVLSREEFVPSNVIVLADASPSMALRDAWRDEAAAARVAEHFRVDKGVDGLRELSRLDLAQKFLTPEFIKSLENDGARIVHLHTFADRLDDQQAADADGIRLEPHGETTALGAAMQQALLANSGLPVAGIVVVTDGQNTAGDPPAEAAKLAADEGVPIIGIAVGTPDGPRNAQVLDVEASPVAFTGDTNQVTIHVQSRGMQDVAATLLLEERKNGGEWAEFMRDNIILGLDGALQTLTYDFSEQRPTKIEFRATLQDAGAELSQDDNVGHAEVRLIRQRMHVLFIAGSTFPEVQFLRNAMYRDRQIEVSSWLMAAEVDYEHPGDAPIRRLPVAQEELNEYDCVVLYDPDPNGWPPNFPELLTSFVSKAGGGLIYIAGEMQTATSFDRQDDPAMSWLNLLPVIREPGLFRSQVQMRLSARAPWRLQITDQGLSDPIFAFASDSEANRRIVESLPGMYWHFPVTRAKPGATVLAVHGDPRMRNEFGPEVLLATQLVGPGRAVFVGFDSTYRWRYLDEQFFDGFWARLVDRAGRNKQLGGGYPFRLTTAQPNYKPGSDVRVVARFNDPADVEPGMLLLHGEVEHGDDEPLAVTLMPEGEPGQFVATFPVARPGTYFVRVWTGDEAAGAVAKAATLPVEVKLPNVELENPALDRAALENLAAATGGAVFDVTQGASVADALRLDRVRRVLEDRQEVWDAPLFYGAVFLLLVVEWVLRKRCRLI